MEKLDIYVACFHITTEKPALLFQCEIQMHISGMVFWYIRVSLQKGKAAHIAKERKCNVT